MEIKYTDNIGKAIKSDHPWAFKTGQWGKVIDVYVSKTNGSECYLVSWGSTVDMWECDDEMAAYEFKAT